MIVDAPQREEALDPRRSFIVEAPAGSGKTGLLVQRILRLLSEVERPESVVAMTFTRKAAAEMKERVVIALRHAAGNPPPTDEYAKKNYDLARAVLKQDEKHGWQLLSDAGRLQIGTIDSLCAMLTRQMPVLSKFGGFGEVVEEASELYLRAARDMLTQLAEGDEESKLVFRRMVLHFDNNVSQLEDQVVKMLGKREQWEHLTSLSDDQLVKDCCTLLTTAEEQLRLVFQRTGKVDFTEIARAARCALGEFDQPSDLLYSLDYRFQHLLVDEFQDTSRSQYELVKALTEQWSLDDEHSLFLVGDPMQSIYGFRDADVSLFLRCWEEEQLGSVRLARVQLKTNFRTTSEILSWIETQCAPNMPNDDRETGAVQFRLSTAGRETAGMAPRLVAHINDAGSEEAAEIVNIIAANPRRQVGILVRGRANALQIFPALRKAGIGYEAIDIDLLQDQQHIIDVLSITRALTNLADRVSWLACLRAPWCGLTLADLSMLAEGKRETTVLDLLSDPNVIASLSVDGRWRAVRAQEILSSGVQRVGRMKLRKLVEQTWHSLGGLAVIAEPNQREDIETLFRLIEESEEGGIIRDYSLLAKRMEFLYAKPAVTDSKVKIMTVHQAKGLEFDIVILPGMNKKGRENERQLLAWTERDGTVEIAAMPQTGEEEAEHTRIVQVLDAKETNELRRLFYVACTRAVNELHLIGSTGLNSKGMLCNAHSKAFLGLIWDNVKPEFESRLRQRLTTTNGKEIRRSDRCPLRRLPLSWQAPALTPAVQIAAPLRRAVASQRQVSYHWVSDNSRHAGTVVHEIFKRMAAEGIAGWNEARVAGLRTMVGSELLRLGVPAEEKKAAADQVMRALAKTIASERGRWILSAHEQAQSEWAVRGVAGGSLVSGNIDRAFVADGTFWIIDYKTGQHDSRDLDRFLASEKQRYQPQLELYAALVSRLVPQPIALGLYFPLHDAWLEWRYAETGAAAGPV